MAVAPLDIAGGAVVSGSFQAFDQSYLVAALAQLGPSFVGVTQIPVDVPNDELRRLDAAGVRAVRFNLRRGGSAPAEHVERLARRVDDVVGWHVELYVDARELADLAPTLRRLPQVVVDHLGLHEDGLPTLLDLVASGAKVKASGFGRVALDVPRALQRIHAVDPGALLFGTDLPSTRTPRPFHADDLRLITQLFEPEDAVRILWDNAAVLYGVSTGHDDTTDQDVSAR